MHIAVLSFKESRLDAPEPHALLVAGEKRGHTMTRLFQQYLTCIEIYGETKLFYNNEELAKFDVIIARPNFVEEPSLHTITLDLLVKHGYRVINHRPTVSISKNKLAQKVLMNEQNIPQPEWAIVRDPSQTELAANKIGFPLVVKVAFGTWGKGVFYTENLKTLSPIVDYLNVRDGNPVIFERFIDEAERKDIRAFLIGGEVIASMERTAKDDEIRANIHAGGSGSKITLTKEEERFAKKAAEAFELEIAGVDMLRSKNGPVVIEVNANPGMSGITEVTGIDVAEQIIMYVEQTSL